MIFDLLDAHFPRTTTVDHFKITLCKQHKSCRNVSGVSDMNTISSAYHSMLTLSMPTFTLHCSLVMSLTKSFMNKLKSSFYFYDRS